jgi:hypothetical protein
MTYTVMLLKLLKYIYYKFQIFLAIEMQKPFFIFKVYLPGMGLFLFNYNVFDTSPVILNSGYVMSGQEIDAVLYKEFNQARLKEIVEVIREYPRWTMNQVIDFVEDDYKIPHNKAYALVNTLIEYTLNPNRKPSQDTHLLYQTVLREYWNEWSHMPRFNFPIIDYTYHYSPCPKLLTKALLPINYYEQNNEINPLKNFELLQSAKSSVRCTFHGYQHHAGFSISARKFHYEISGAHIVDLMRAVSGKSNYSRLSSY